MSHKNIVALLFSCLITTVGSIYCGSTIYNNTDGDITVDGINKAGKIITLTIKKDMSLSLTTCYTYNITIKSLNGNAAGQTCLFHNRYFAGLNECPCEIEITVKINSDNLLKAVGTYPKGCSA